MKEKILEFLKQQDGFVSGQRICDELGVSRTAVWKYMNSLKKEGYEEMDYAKLDTTRKARTGFAEVVYCARKADEHLLNIYQNLYE